MMHDDFAVSELPTYYGESYDVRTRGSHQESRHWRGWVANYLTRRMREGPDAEVPHAWLTATGQPRCAACSSPTIDGQHAGVSWCERHEAIVRAEIDNAIGAP